MALFSFLPKNLKNLFVNIANPQSVNSEKALVKLFGNELSLNLTENKFFKLGKKLSPILRALNNQVISFSNFVFKILPKSAFLIAFNIIGKCLVIALSGVIFGACTTLVSQKCTTLMLDYPMSGFAKYFTPQCVQLTQSTHGKIIHSIVKPMFKQISFISLNIVTHHVFSKLLPAMPSVCVHIFKVILQYKDPLGRVSDIDEIN